MQKLRLYYRLSKPGIVYGNAIHIVGGALLAWHAGFDVRGFIGVFVGTSLLIASACAANNYIDRGIDTKMTRTRKRPSVTGAVPFKQGVTYAVMTFLLGLALLIWLTNILVVAMGLVAYLFYVVIYAWAKRTTVHSTLIGSIPGALPAMAGYVAMTGSIDLTAWLIFLLIAIWQMPHFYAISLFRKKDYAAAGLPVLGVVAPFSKVRTAMLAYIVIYVLVAVAMIILASIGIVAGLLLAGLGLYWLFVSSRPVDDETGWARKVFGVSLIITLAFPVIAAINIVLSA